MTYHRRISVEFNHCDPAGIVFYPRYFEMTNSVVENFFAEVIGYSFRRIMDEGAGVPTARIETDFTAPSRLGDVLDFSLQIRRIGGASVQFDLRAECDGQQRMAAALTLVWITNGGKAAPWPDEIRDKMTQFKERRDAS